MLLTLLVQVKCKTCKGKGQYYEGDYILDCPECDRTGRVTTTIRKVKEIKQYMKDVKMKEVERHFASDE